MEEKRKWRNQNTQKTQEEYKRCTNKLERYTKKAKDEWQKAEFTELEYL